MRKTLLAKSSRTRVTDEVSMIDLPTDGSLPDGALNDDHLGTLDAVRRAFVKGLVEALRTYRVRSCLRPVGAGNEYPAGPDAGPHGSSPNQQNALVMAPALFLGLPSRSVGSHRFAVALDEDFQLLPLIPAQPHHILLYRNLLRSHDPPPSSHRRQSESSNPYKLVEAGD